MYSVLIVHVWNQILVERINYATEKKHKNNMLLNFNRKYKQKTNSLYIDKEMKMKMWFIDSFLLPVIPYLIVKLSSILSIISNIKQWEFTIGRFIRMRKLRLLTRMIRLSRKLGHTRN